MPSRRSCCLVPPYFAALFIACSTPAADDGGAATGDGTIGVSTATSNGVGASTAATEATAAVSDTAGTTGADTGTTADAPTELVMSITDHGVTWTFDAPVSAGQFVTGEWFIVGPATVASIDPPPSPGRNGSIVNLPLTQDRSPWDDRVESDRFDPSLRRDPPVALAVGEALLSSISVDQVGMVENWLREGNGEASASPVWSISVLTCLAEAPPVDAFRPSFADPEQRIYRLSQLDRAAIGSVALPASVNLDPTLPADFAARFVRPWVDNVFYGFDAQVEYMPMYGREWGRAVGIASMLLLADLPAEHLDAQEQILIGFVQRGIDLWGMVRAGYPGWYAHGGHGSGRKWPIVWSGLMLGDEEMASPTSTLPAVQFGEDMHTAYAADVPGGGPTWWDQSSVVYTGHMGLWEGAVVSDTPGWGPYEHLPPEQWLADALGESYRRCCTSIAWAGQALAARIVGAQDAWGHDAFFDYVDRWMDPAGDAEYVAAISQANGHDFSGDYAAQGQAWDGLVEAMWASYR